MAKTPFPAKREFHTPSQRAAQKEQGRRPAGTETASTGQELGNSAANEAPSLLRQERSQVS